MSVKPTPARRRAGPSDRRPTLKDIAAELGVTAATVSNAYNRPDQLSPELRTRVLETARTLGYAGPDPMARGLRRGRAGAIGVLYADRLSYAFKDPVAVALLAGIATAAEAAGLGLLLVPGSPREERDLDAARRAAVDGFVVYSMAQEDPLLSAALERRLPIVTVDMPGRSAAPSVAIDDVASARTVAEHLVGLGHRRFGVLSLELTPDVRSGLADSSRQQAASYPVSRGRLRGYREALEAAGLSWDEVPVQECAENSVEEGRAAAERLLERGSGPTALLAMSDALALGALEAGRRAGLTVPKDLSVVGFDDIPEAAGATPPLTTVHEPHLEKGLKAGEILVALLAGEEFPSVVTLPTRLIVRGSSAPPGASGPPR
ncbi:MAG: LacI family DNA-binding transcriptional regulator [Chloroflexi bacterium]|nr:LacI family DNA-binding transcriptional regulator [Chloroflexota bacterium]